MTAIAPAQNKYCTRAYSGDPILPAFSNHEWLTKRERAVAIVMAANPVDILGVIYAKDYAETGGPALGCVTEGSSRDSVGRRDHHF